MENFELPYSDYLAQGRPWSPLWTEDYQGMNWQLVIAPPGVETIDSASDYFALLARRVEWLLEDWIDRYSDELPVRVDRDDPVAVREGALAMIEDYVPDFIGISLQPALSNRQIATAIAMLGLSPKFNLPSFPVNLPHREADDELEAELREDFTLKGWLLQAQP